VTTTLDTAYEAVDEEQLARAYIESKRMTAPRDKKESARTMRRLIGAGFSPPTVFKVLRAWLPDKELAEEIGVFDVPDDAAGE
jgi:SOS response regulatory protein OraA/RecX